MSYLGRSAKLSLKAQEKVSFLATAGQTVKTGLSYTPSFVEVYVNGVLLTDSTDFTATNGNSITFTVALLLNDEVTVISLKTFTVADHYNKTEADTLLAAKATVANFTSTGIDDNATSTAITIDASENVGIGTATTYGKATIEHAKGINNGLTLAVSDATANDNITGIQFSTNSVVSRPRAAIYSKSVTSQGVAGWGADLIFATRGAPDASTISESDASMRIDPGGNVTVNTGNLVIGTNGKGIDFSANADSSATGASTTSELLDDYEEGTWTPVLTDGKTGSGNYVKIGRLVTVNFLFANIGGSGSTAQRVTALPFTSYTQNGGSYSEIYKVEFPSNAVDFILFTYAGSTTLGMTFQVSDGIPIALTGSHVDHSSSTLNGTITYQTS
jgi:hypothetical protein